MRMIAVDDEELALSNLLFNMGQVQPDAEIIGFQSPGEAFDYLSAHAVDIAFLDIEMGELSGIALAKKCKDLCPTVNIIFVTGYSQYTMDALQLHVSGYLIKPVRAGDLRTELANLRHPVPPTGKRVRIQAFGDFEIFVDNKPLSFSRTKCKECLAYLVDRRGAFVGTQVLSALLWEDRPYDRIVQNNTHRVVSDLLKSLKAAGIAGIIIKTRSGIAIDTEQVDCDFFRFINGDMAQVNAFRGEYMTNYSWAEFTLAQLDKDKNKG